VAQTALWLTILGMGLATYAIRLLLIVLWGRVTMPEPLQRALRFVPPAVLSAIVFPELLRREGSLDVSMGNTRLLAGIMAAFVAWRTKNALLTICAGMAMLWGLQAVARWAAH
jgi:branched-subunit amino acid transport protein